MSSSEQMAKSRETLTPRPIDRGVRIGHVHLKVADLERALKFYCGVLGFELTQRRAGAALLSAGGDHHPHPPHHPGGIGGAPPPPPAPRAFYSPRPSSPP